MHSFPTIFQPEIVKVYFRHIAYHLQKQTADCEGVFVGV